MDGGNANRHNKLDQFLRVISTSKTSGSLILGQASCFFQTLWSILRPISFRDVSQSIAAFLMNGILFLPFGDSNTISQDCIFTATLLLFRICVGKDLLQQKSKITSNNTTLSILLIVQKSQGQPPGMYISNPVKKWVDFNYQPTSTW